MLIERAAHNKAPWHHHKPAPTPVPGADPSPVSNSPIWGVNYGHNFAGHAYYASLATSDLDELKAAGVKAIRTYIPEIGTSDVDFTQKLALLAKSRGFIVTWGVCTGGGVTTSRAWSKYLASLEAYAAFAATNGVDYFTMGNEEEFNLDSTTIQNGIRTKAAQLKCNHPNLKLTYAAAASPDNITAWLANTGVLDTIGMNVYVDYTGITDRLKVNSKMTITEWNTDDGLNFVNGDQTKWADALVPIRDTINASGIPAYLFTTRGGGGGIDDTWSMWVGDTRRPAWSALLNG